MEQESNIKKEKKKCKAIQNNGNKCKYAVKIGDYCGRHQYVEHVTRSSYTITFGDVAENHIGMQQVTCLNLEKDEKEPLTISDLIQITSWFRERKCSVEVYDLNKNLPSQASKIDCEKAQVIVVRFGIFSLLEDQISWSLEDLHKQIMMCKWDDKIYKDGKIIDKKARHNICFSNYDQDIDLKNGKGTVCNFDRYPPLKLIRENLNKILNTGLKEEKEENTKLKDLVAEGNYYYDLKTCGIGFHGDKERRIVVGMRFGDESPLCFQWFYKGIPVGDKERIELKHSDIYFMSGKAVGFDHDELTLKHSAGAEKYLTPAV
tara:strand:- start:4911 stop:5864 length:954 start_codon:yes stop_codon:yes gene_type:complete